MHDELRQVRDLEAAAEVQVRMSVRTFESIRQRRIRLEAIYGEEKEGKQGILIVGPWIAAAAAGFEVARRWLRGNTRSVAAFGGGAAVGLATALGAAQFSGSPPHDRPGLAESAPPAPALPPLGHTNPPRIGPPKSGPPGPVKPAPPAPPSSAKPGPTGSAAPRGGPGVPSTPAEPPAGPSPTPPPAEPPTEPPASGEPDGDEPTCRIYLPHLVGRGLLCGHLAT